MVGSARSVCALMLCCLGTLTAPVGAQASGADSRRDSVSVRFVDAELKSVVQALGQHLDRPLVIAGLPTARVTLETPTPVPRSGVLPLLRGLLESQGLRLMVDSTAGLYRIENVAPEPTPSTPIDDEPPTQLLAPAPLRLFTVRLRHARASDVAATVSTLYGRASAIGELGTRRPPLSDQLQGNRAATIAPPPGPIAPTMQARPTGSLSSDVVIVPDAGTNALMIRASERDFVLIQEAVQALDVRPQQVLIEVLIAEVRKDRGFSFGIGANVPATPIPGAGNATVGGSTAGIGLGDFVMNVMNVGGVDLDATLRAAAARGDVSIVSRPVVLAANNELAQILVGSQRPFVQVSRSLPTDAP